jgi:anti-anti-sigma factor
MLVAQSGTHAQIRVEGRGSFENAGAFKQAYTALIGKGAKDFVVDLGTCEHLDSTFLGIMIGFGLRTKEVSGSVRIINASNPTVNLFKEVGLDRLFIFDEPTPE